MACLGAKVRDVYDRRRIIGQHTQHLTRCQSLQAFTCFQHWQWAQQPFGIKIGIVCHSVEVGAMFQFVHQLVTTWTVTLYESSLKQGQRK